MLTSVSYSLRFDDKNDGLKHHYQKMLFGLRRPGCCFLASLLLLLVITAHNGASLALKNLVHRRQVVKAAGLASWIAVRPLPAVGLSETVGKDEKCNDPSCLGVWDGILANCPAVSAAGGAGCVSSQDDTSMSVFAEPWDYADLLVGGSGESSEESWKAESQRLLPVIERTSRKRGDDVRLVFREGRYTRVVFVDGKTGEESTGEFYYTPNDTTVQFRLSSSSSAGSLLSFSNRERCESIRKELGYLKLPVVRTRPANDFSPGEWALAKAMGLI